MSCDVAVIHCINPVRGYVYTKDFGNCLKHLFHYYASLGKVKCSIFSLPTLNNCALVAQTISPVAGEKVETQNLF